MKITLEMEENIINEFKEISEFWFVEKEKIVKPTIQETLRKYIIEKINKRREELIISQAVMNIDLLKEENITL